MNVERLTEIAEWLEAGAPHKGGVVEFDMCQFFTLKSACGSACCIGGAAIQFFGDADSDATQESEAAHLLDLQSSTAKQLFYAAQISEEDDECAYPEELATITPAWAARTIRHLIATGEVDWEETRSAP